MEIREVRETRRGRLAVSKECVCIQISINSSVSRRECVRQTSAVTNEYISMGLTVSQYIVVTPVFTSPSVDPV